MINLLRVLGDRMTLYLPIILMGLLALGTYWLVRSTPLLMLQGKEAQVRHEPDYFMRNFSVKSFDVAGRLKTEVFAFTNPAAKKSRWHKHGSFATTFSGKTGAGADG